MTVQLKLLNKLCPNLLDVINDGSMGYVSQIGQSISNWISNSLF